MASGKKKGLGKGLSALITGRSGDDIREQLSASPEEHGERVLQLDPREIRPNPRQPRTHFDEGALQELADSLKRDGVQEPVIVRRAEGAYQLVSGERRVRASVLADLKTIPAICREVSDADMLKLGLIENIQREDLNAIELAAAYRRLIDECGWTQEEMADQVGKNRATVANTLRLLQLPELVQQRVADGSISMGHARALLAVDSVQEQLKIARRIVDEGLSVRQVERMASPKPKTAAGASKKDPNVTAIEDELRRRLGTRVTMRPSSPGKGKIEIEYFNLDELDRILELLRGSR